MGDWILDEKELKQEAINFYKELHGEHPGRMCNLHSSSFSPLELGDIQFLSKSVSDEEIKVTLFDMAPLKVSGTDRFHALNQTLVIPLLFLFLRSKT